jgi:hypothetical protein
VVVWGAVGGVVTCGTVTVGFVVGTPDPGVVTTVDTETDDVGVVVELECELEPEELEPEEPGR